MALGGYTCVIDQLVCEGSQVAVPLTFSGVQRDRLFGVEATGRRVAWSGAAFFSTEAGRITSLWVLGDVDAVRRQLGSVEAVSPFG